MTSLPAFLDAHGAAIQAIGEGLAIFAVTFAAGMLLWDRVVRRPARPARKFRSF